MIKIWGTSIAELSSKERLLYATHRSLIEKGHAGTTAKEIARYAGLNHGLIHHYFGSKEQLYVELVRHIEDRMNRFLDQMETPRSLLKYFLTDGIEDHPIDQELGLAAREMPELRDVLKENMSFRKKKILSRLGAETEMDAMLFMATIRGVQMLSPLDPDLNLDAVLDRIAEKFLGHPSALDRKIKPWVEPENCPLGTLQIIDQQSIPSPML